MMTTVILLAAPLLQDPPPVQVTTRRANGGYAIDVQCRSKAYPRGTVIEARLGVVGETCAEGSSQLKTDVLKEVGLERFSTATRRPGVRFHVARAGFYRVTLSTRPSIQTSFDAAAALSRAETPRSVEMIVVVGDAHERLREIQISARWITQKIKNLDSIPTNGGRSSARRIERFLGSLRAKGCQTLSGTQSWLDSYAERLYSTTAFESNGSSGGRPVPPARPGRPGPDPSDDDRGHPKSTRKSASTAAHHGRRAAPRYADGSAARSILGRECGILLLREAKLWLDSAQGEMERKHALNALVATRKALLRQHPSFSRAAAKVADVLTRLEDDPETARRMIAQAIRDLQARASGK
jgi:hypothetical protein